MPVYRRTLMIAALLLTPTLAKAQSDSVCLVGGVGMSTRTYTLRGLYQEEAAKLVSPYIVNACGAVYAAGVGAGALTVVVPRANAGVLNTVDSLLRVFDVPSRTIALRFQLAVTTDQAGTDSRLAQVESALRGLFSFRGYRLLAEGTTVVGEQTDFGLTMSGEQQRFIITGDVGRVQGGETPMVRLSVGLTSAPASGSDSTGLALQMMSMMPGNQFLRTGLTLPFGKTAVLGSGTTDGQSGVLILIVRPELR